MLKPGIRYPLELFHIPDPDVSCMMSIGSTSRRYEVSSTLIFKVYHVSTVTSAVFPLSARADTAFSADPETPYRDYVP